MLAFHFTNVQFLLSWKRQSAKKLYILNLFVIYAMSTSAKRAINKCWYLKTRLRLWPESCHNRYSLSIHFGQRVWNKTFIWTCYITGPIKSKLWGKAFHLKHVNKRYVFICQFGLVLLFSSLLKVKLRLCNIYWIIGLAYRCEFSVIKSPIYLDYWLLQLLKYL